MTGYCSCGLDIGDPRVSRHSKTCAALVIERLERERSIIMDYVFYETPFDVFDGVDLHEEASVNAEAFGREEPTREDYYAAFLTCISHGRGA